MTRGVEGEEWRGSEPSRGGEPEAGELGERLPSGDLASFRIKTCNIGGAYARGGVFNTRRKREAGGEKCGASIGFGGGLRCADEQCRAAGNSLWSAHAEFDAGGSRGVIGRENHGFLAGGGEQRGRALRGAGFEPEHGMQREIGDVEDGEHEGSFGFWVLSFGLWS